MDGKWKMENGHHSCGLLGRRGEVHQVPSLESAYPTLPTSGVVGPAREGELALSIRD